MAHHSFSRGRPRQLRFQTVSTLDLAPPLRFDFWCTEILRNVRVDPPNARQRQDFQATIVSLATATGEMHYARSDAFNAHITRKTIRQASCDELALFLVLNGEIRLRYERDETASFARGDFFLLDGTRPTSLCFSQHEVIQIDLSRPMLESVFTGALPPPARINAALARSRLAGLLRRHLQQFPRSVKTLRPVEQLGLLDASESFAIATIEAAFFAEHPSEAATGAGLFAAAQGYIRRHLAQPDLNPGTVAAAIGCSRSTLYRLFARRQLTVQGYIRELRLLQSKHASASIKVLATRCGLYDMPNVNRLFRQRFGMTPSQAMAGAHVHHQGG